MINIIFRIVAESLNAIAGLTGFTYNEINIIVYYILIPLVYIALLDRIFKKHILKVIYIALWILGILLIPDFEHFCDSLFQASVDFLLWFRHFGMNYIVASVVICVILPAIVFAILSILAFPSLRMRAALLFPRSH